MWAGGLLHRAQRAHVQRAGDAVPGDQGTMLDDGAHAECAELRGAGAPQDAQPHPQQRPRMRERQRLPTGDPYLHTSAHVEELTIVTLTKSILYFCAVSHWGPLMFLELLQVSAHRTPWCL